MGHLATHVLVVDDDLDVLTVLVAVLNDSGFVTTAADGADAMRDMLSGKGVPIDVIVLDCKIPGSRSRNWLFMLRRCGSPSS